MKEFNRLNLPLKCAYGYKGFGTIDFREWHFIEDAKGKELDSEKSISAIVEIVNSHAQLKIDLDRAINAGAAHADRADELYAENARLREFVKRVANADIEHVDFEIGDGDTDYIEYICTDFVEEADELLTELEKGDE